uniref:DnaJ homolog subfamily C member 2 n=1 Tax=Panagrolaimus superbus TaxID=310955 RepID=A0A914XXM4_9BILA
MQVAIYGFQNRIKRIEDAGIAYELNLILDRLALGLSPEPVLKNYRRAGKDSPTLEELEAEEDEALFDEDCDGYRKFLSKLCPKTWREQDHYKVLGLSKLRYRATPGQIKTAYRQKVLRYHPDKGKYKEQLGVQGNDAFSCIQKAYELMCEEDKRRSYDSIDPDFEEETPTASEINTKNFFTKLGPVFEANARFSKVQPAPLLGDINASRSDVEHFYEFWYSFPSWREFSYLDAEDKSKGEDRYERREIEKQNKIEREKLRKQDSKRISNLIHLAYDKDPRIVIFKKEDKQKKEDEKERKRLEKQKREDERRAVELEEERKKAEEEEKVKEEKKKADKARQAEKKVTAAKRKKLREVAANAEYWTKHSGSKLVVMEHIERICIAGNNDQLDEMTEKLAGLTVYDEVVELLTNRTKKDATQKVAKKETSEVIGGKESGWTDEQISLLVKAANIFPAGTSRRWAQVTSYINDHHRDGVPKTEKEVIKQAKLQAAQVVAPVDASKTQGQKETTFNSNGAPVTSSNSTTNATVAPASSNGTSIPLDDWNTDEQMNFENALKTIPASDPKRWEKIGEATGKTKKECIQRYKKIVEMLKARK